jgi:hypothetical protein
VTSITPASLGKIILVGSTRWGGAVCASNRSLAKSSKKATRHRLSIKALDFPEIISCVADYPALMLKLLSKVQKIDFISSMQNQSFAQFFNL